MNILLLQIKRVNEFRVNSAVFVSTIQSEQFLRSVADDCVCLFFLKYYYNVLTCTIGFCSVFNFLVTLLHMTFFKRIYTLGTSRLKFQF